MKKTEAEKLEINSLEKFFKLSADMLAIVGSEGELIKVNPAFCRMLGFTEEELTGDRFIHYVHPEDVPATLSRSQRIQQTYTSVPFENRYRRKDGSYRWIAWTCQFDPDSNTTFCIGRDVTEHKQLEAELVVKKRAIDAVSTGVILTDPNQPDNPIVYVNHAFEKITGYTAAEVLGKNCWFLAGDDRQQQGQQAIREALESRREVKTVLRNYRKDGSLFYNRLAISPVYNEEGKLTHFIGSQIDITKEVTAEQKLQASEKRLDLALKGSSLAIWDWDIGKDLFTLDNHWAEIYEEAKAREMGGYAYWRSLIHPEEVLNWERQLKNHLNGISDAYYCEYRIRDTRGRWHWIADRGKVVERGPENEPLRMAGTHLDIGRRKSSQIALMKSFKLITDLNTALDESNIVARTDARGIITYVNEKFCKISGYTKRELLGKTHRIINSGYHPKEFFEEMWQCIQSGKVWWGEIRNKKKNGEFYWVDTTIVPIMNEHNKPQQYIALRKDITQRKQGEQALRELNEKLERRLEDFNQFAYIASHNLRAPVASILGLMNLLKNGDVPETELPEWADRVMKVGQQLDQVVYDLNQILSVRMRSTDNRKLVYFREIVDEVKTLLAQEIAQSDAHISIDFTALPAIRSIKSYLTSIFFHLVENAIKFRKPGHPPHIQIRTSLDEEKVQIFIKDNGLGLDLSQHGHKLFKLYQRFHPEIPGRGMGLHFVWQQVEALGGKIEAQSEEGAGMTFVIQFDRSGLKRFKDIRRVFLIDDDEVLNMIHSRIIQITTPQISTVKFKDAREALQLIIRGEAEQMPDLILLDLNMPDMDGWEFLEALEKLPQNLLEDIDVVILSSSIFAEDRIKAERYQVVSEYLSKPLSKEMWMKLLEPYEL